MKVGGVEQSGLQQRYGLDPDEAHDPLPLDLTVDATGTVLPPRAPLGALHVERVEAMALVRCQTAWADLVTRAIEPNVFLEPAFALPLLQHVAYPQRPAFLLVWEESGPASFGRLLGLFPLSLPRGPVSLDGIARGLANKQTGCGIPLVDRARAAETLGAVFAWLARFAGRADALLLTDVPAAGAFRAALAEACAEDRRACVVIESYRRAALRRHDDVEGRVVALLSAKRRKERARQRRRLAESGVRVSTSARTPAEIAAATERFLALEHNGWKGARGTALLADPTLATFTRTMTRLMAHEGRCRIDSIELDGRPVAMGIVLRTADRAYFWKTAFDERYAALSPGVQLVVELTQAQIAEPGIRVTDSCAIADHPMIDRIWPDRIEMVDLMVAGRPGGGFARSCRIERVRRALRARAKRLMLRLRRPKHERGGTTEPARLSRHDPNPAIENPARAPDLDGIARAREPGWSRGGSGSTNGSGSPGW